MANRFPGQCAAGPEVLCLAGPLRYPTCKIATHPRIFDSPLAPDVICGNLVPDAQLAAILFQNGVRTLYTRDRDFRKFECFQVRDPFLP